MSAFALHKIIKKKSGLRLEIINPNYNLISQLSLSQF